MKNHNVRWALQYSDKAARIGSWNNPEDRPDRINGGINRHGLVIAQIDAKNLNTGEIECKASCAGTDFMEFEWLATVTTTLFSGPNIHYAYPNIIGLRLLSKTGSYSFYSNGHLDFKEMKLNGYY